MFEKYIFLPLQFKGHHEISSHEMRISVLIADVYCSAVFIMVSTSLVCRNMTTDLFDLIISVRIRKSAVNVENVFVLLGSQSIISHELFLNSRRRKFLYWRDFTSHI